MTAVGIMCTGVVGACTVDSDAKVLIVVGKLGTVVVGAGVVGVGAIVSIAVATGSVGS